MARGRIIIRDKCQETGAWNKGLYILHQSPDDIFYGSKNTGFTVKDYIIERVTGMDYIKGRVAKLLVDYFGGDFRRITHAFEVLRHAENLMEDEENCDYEVLVAAALLHDVGIKRSEEVLGYNNGQTQEEYGPPIAEKLLESIGFPPDKTEKVCEIIGNHHSRPRYDYVELEILRQADRIVNSLEKS